MRTIDDVRRDIEYNVNCNALGRICLLTLTDNLLQLNNEAVDIALNLSEFKYTERDMQHVFENSQYCGQTFEEFMEEYNAPI